MRSVINFLILNKIKNSNLGFITITESNENIPYNIQRVYWTNFTNKDITRGGYTHLNLEQVIFDVSGIIIFTSEVLFGNKTNFILDSINKGFYIHRKIWKNIKFSQNVVLFSRSSEKYTEANYIYHYYFLLQIKNVT